jgi:hypothetical protein
MDHMADRELVFPSPDAPAFPNVRVARPDGWNPVVLPDSVLALRRTEDVVEGVVPNVMIGITRHTRDWSLQDEMAAVDEALAALDGAEVAPVDAPAVGGADDSITQDARLVTFHHPDSGPVVQVHLVARAETGGLADVVSLVGTVPQAGFQEDLETIKRVAASLRLSRDPR